MPAYALTIFIGAFLLFQVQPLLGKYILPWFGGGPGVWTTCLLFFQLVLLAGYAYAHWLSRWLKPSRQVIVHLALLGAALARLPITPAETWKPPDELDPVLRILALLTTTVGLPYFVLSSTGPLMQQWFSRTHPGVSPYRLYALSNTGSLLALVSYPVWFETHLTRKAQAMAWGWGLVAYALGCGLCGWKAWKSDQGKEARGEAAGATSGITDPLRRRDSAASHASPSETLNSQPSTLNTVLWLLWPACASVLLLATTNKICQDVASVPFLWVLPLALYLLSFIICFDNPRWYKPVPFAFALTAAFGGICWALFPGTHISLRVQLAIYLAGLFICSMVCHGEVYRLKPQPRHLTRFYLMIAAGGAAGGLFVALAAPMLFTSYSELHYGLFLCALLFTLVRTREQNLLGLLHWKLFARAGLWFELIALASVLWLLGRKSDPDIVYASRNFYGVLTIFEHQKDKPGDHHFLLQHGVITHGLQFTDSQQAKWPTTYYGEQSGLGLAVSALPPGPRRIGVVGLGAGTSAAYGRAGDSLRIYEINPEVSRLAASWFKYLTNCPGRVKVVLGDARLSLERERPQGFDLLTLDAFSSDSIPVHLLTREAFALYERHMKTNGIIAVHVSNHYLDLEPVVTRLARHFNYKLAVIDYDELEDDWWLYSCTWILLTHDESIINSPALRWAATPPRTNSISTPLWTDDFASLFQILK